MRGKRAPKRTIAPDPIYNSRVISKFINRVMIGGKKTIAQDDRTCEEWCLQSKRNDHP